MAGSLNMCGKEGSEATEQMFGLIPDHKRAESPPARHAQQSLWKRQAPAVYPPPGKV